MILTQFQKRKIRRVADMLQKKLDNILEIGRVWVYQTNGKHNREPIGVDIWLDYKKDDELVKNEDVYCVTFRLHLNDNVIVVDNTILVQSAGGEVGQFCIERYGNSRW